MVAGRSFATNLPRGVTVTCATPVVDPSTEKLGHTKFPRLQKIGRPR
jgi:hypothetical protein